MEIKVRQISPMIVKRIDELAKRKNVSREEFLREQLELISVMDVLKKEREELDKGFNHVIDLFIKTSEQLSQMEIKYEKLVQLISLATEIDLHKIDVFIGDHKRLLQ